MAKKATKGTAIMIGVMILAIGAGFLALFRVKKVRKAYLNKQYDHFIDGTILPIGEYVGYIDEMHSTSDYASTTGAQYSGGYPPADLDTKSSFVVEYRWT